MSATSRRVSWPRRLRLRATDLVDVFVYLVVLGAFIQLFPSVIAESFLLALLFGDAVRLGGFWAVTLLVAVLTLARGLVRSVLDSSPAPHRDTAL